jgi:prepilin-type N-terminal cleavage/methylation domain-containing protein
MNKTSPTPVQGFTLIEMTVVLLLITLLASVAIRETNSLSFQVRYEQTQERLERIREAILGNPRQIINGQQAVSGFVADMGRLPGSIKELIQLSSYCSDAAKLTKADCENALGAIWFGRKSYGFCNLNFPNETQCLANSGSWMHLFYGGWNGPYLNISGNPADSDAFTDGWGRLAQGYCSNIIYTNQTTCEASTAVWTPLASDNNYGWYYAASTNDLLIQSYGKDHVSGGLDYDADYPALETQPAVKGQDWQVDISEGISISFIKPYNRHLIVSKCSDPTKSSKADCESAGKAWYGGCNQAGYFNKDSCPAGAWSNCSDGTSATRSDCELAGKIWYGEGYGCSDQLKTTKTDCEAVLKVWRSCTDGTITQKDICENQQESWFGDSIYTIPLSGPYSTYWTHNICMNIFYRANGAFKYISSSLVTIEENGSYQELRFSNFKDQSGTVITDIPIGKNAIGIYEYDGDCNQGNTLYPADRQNPIQVDFHPRAGLPAINW